MTNSTAQHSTAQLSSAQLSSAQLSSAQLSSADALLALVAGVASLALYTRTLVPWPLPGDSGEFQVLAYELGVAHTTGYPVYMVLAHLFQGLLPIGEVAYRVNLFSAFMAALTVAGVYLGGQLLSGNRWAAMFGALSLAVGFTFWSQAIIAEVYTAGAAFFIAVFLLLVGWYKTGNRWTLGAAGLVGGLGLGVHGSVSLFAPAVGVFLLANWDRRREWLLPALGGGLLGVALYAAAFLAVDLHAPPANIFNAAYGPAHSAWDLTERDLRDPVTRIVFLASARQWRTVMFTNPAKEMPEHLAAFISKLPRDLFPLTAVLAVFGLVVLIRRDWRLAVLMGTGLLCQLLVYFNYNIPDIYVLYIPTYLLLAMLAAAGIGGQWTNFRGQTWRRGRILQPVLITAVALIGIVPLISLQWIAVRDGKPAFMEVKDLPILAGLRKTAADTVRLLEPNAIVFTDWNWLYLYYYAAHVEQGRTDLRFVETYPWAEKWGLARSVPEFVQANFQEHPIYFSQRVGEIEGIGFTLQSVMLGPTQLYKTALP